MHLICYYSCVSERLDSQTPLVAHPLFRSFSIENWEQANFLATQRLGKAIHVYCCYLVLLKLNIVWNTHSIPMGLPLTQKRNTLAFSRNRVETEQTPLCTVWCSSTSREIHIKFRMKVGWYMGCLSGLRG